MRLLLFMCGIIGVSLATAMVESEAERFTGRDSYCYCGMVDGQPDGWDPKEIWLDIFFIFDTSISMADHLEEIVFNLNMNSTDDLRKVRLTRNATADFDAAVQAATQAFNKNTNYLAQRVQQVIYFLTKTSQELTWESKANYFKRSGGINIVNDFGSDGVTDPGLMELASPFYYFTDLPKDPMRNLALLCEANCWCDLSNPTFHAFNDDEINPRTQANRGCYRFNLADSNAKARKFCSTMGAISMPVQGTLVSIHDKQKEFFMSGVSSLYKGPYWIALRNNGTSWNWDDDSTNPFADWGPGQPDTKNGTAMCGYAIQATGFNVEWGAADCQDKLNYVCEMAPCSVGHLCEPCPGCNW